MLCIINIFRRLRVVCLPSMALSAMACWRCQTTPLTISANHEGRPARGVAKKNPIDFRNVIAKSRTGCDRDNHWAIKGEQSEITF